MISRFFIDRPIFATVLSLVITLAGALALLALPIAQYPEITPPSIQVAISYPGASARVVADTVAAPVEQQVNGVPGMLYLSSQCGNDGSYALTVTFEVGTDLNTALVMVQNRVALAMPQLPVEVQQQGITIKKKTPDILLVVNFYSPGGRYDDVYLSNFATINVRDELFRLEGVSDINMLGERDYSIRVWLDPQKLAALNISAPEVAAAIRSQNVEVAVGQVGQPPAGRSAGARGQPFELPVDTLGRLTDPEQFGNIIIKVGQGQVKSGPAGVSESPGPPGTTAQPSTSRQPGPTGQGNATGSQSGTSTQSGSSGGSTVPALPATITPPGTPALPGASTQPSMRGPARLTPGQAGATAPAAAIQYGVSGPLPPGPSLVRLRDVARIELAAQNYNQACTFDGQPSVGLGVHLLPGTNAFDVANRVRAKMEELQKRFPDGVAYDIAYDITPFIRESIDDVVRTLLEAVALVAIVVLVFLQNWRSAIIPLVAVPVAIIGTFAVMAALGFSLNNISLFGLVLAIGIVVDDAIVVVENVERWLEKGLPPREAARKAMDEVTGPVIAVALVLCAVFVPCAFISGITGRFFRQFAVTISVSTVFSAFNSLTLSPALAALLLKPHGTRRDPLTWLLDVTLGWFFRLFNWGFNLGTAAYTRAVGGLLRVSLLVLLVYGGMVFLTVYVFERAPTGFVPQQDQGRAIVSVQLPDSASLERTQKAMALVEDIARNTPGVAHTITASGMSLVLGANASNFATMFVIFKPFAERTTPELGGEAIMARMRQQYARRVRDAQVIVFGAPPIPGLSVAGGFKLMVEDRGGLGVTNLERQTNTLVGKLQKQPGLVGVSSQFRARTPQLFMDINRTKVESLGVSPADLNQTLQIYLGSLYVNSFNEFGRYWQVTLQAEGKYRNRVENVYLLEVRNRSGSMVPLGTLVDLREVTGPVMILRYNLYTAAPLTGNLAPGASSGDAIANIDTLARQSLPRSMSTEWTELMFMQIRAGNTALYVFLLAVVFVFLALAALYESWSLPLAVILVVPLCLLCSVAGVLFTNKAVDIFVQIGLVVLVGLACKNAILIVEFAKQKHDEGQPRREATLEAVRLRLRPILMTSFAFILGVLPLVVASGAGAEMRRSLGTAVFAGMLGVTLFGIFLTPVFFYVIEGLGEMRLFTAAATRWAGSALFGALLGLIAGYLLVRVHAVRPVWGEAVGAAAGVLVALFVPTIQRMRARSKG